MSQNESGVENDLEIFILSPKFFILVYFPGILKTIYFKNHLHQKVPLSWL